MLRSKRQQQSKIAPLTPIFPEQQDHFSGFSESKIMKESVSNAFTDPDLMMSSIPILSNVKQIPENILKIVSKSKDERSAAQNAISNKYLGRLNFFKMLAEHFSQQIVKYILRSGHLKLYSEGQVITTIGRKMKMIRILLNGEVDVIEQEEEQEDKDASVWQILSKLVDKLGKQTKNYKLKGMSQNKNAITDVIQFIAKTQIAKKRKIDNVQTIYPETILNYQQLLQYEPKHKRTLVITGQKTLMFVINLQDFYESLLLHYKHKQNEAISLFRKVPFFNYFENSKLKLLIQRLITFQVKKGQFIYKQGDATQYFYLLVEGEVQITKKIGLFKENPNNLYKNRVKMSKQKFELDIKTLPYADFDGVYNYHSHQKLITLAIINPISIFGEEELIQKEDRQVNAKVLSLTAKMYRIGLNDLQDFCGKIASSQTEKKMTLFQLFALIQESVTMKKILFRQNQLSQMVEHQNKARYQSLFQDNQKKRSFSKNNSNFASVTAPSRMSKKKVINSQEEVPPTFNNFNFTDFMNDSSRNIESYHSVTFSREQARIMKLTHAKYHDENNNKNKEKVIRFRNFSGSKLKPNKESIDKLATLDTVDVSSPQFKAKEKKTSKSQPKQSITLDEPLFTVKYFKNQEQRQRKLVTVAKKKQLQTIYRNTDQLHRVH